MTDKIISNNLSAFRQRKSSTGRTSITAREKLLLLNKPSGSPLPVKTPVRSEACIPGVHSQKFV